MSSIAIYMQYLLRYVTSYPVSASQLHKMASDRKFLRLADWLGALPEDQMFVNARSVMDEFKGHSKPARTTSDK